MILEQKSLQSSPAVLQCMKIMTLVLWVLWAELDRTTRSILTAGFFFKPISQYGALASLPNRLSVCSTFSFSFCFFFSFIYFPFSSPVSFQSRQLFWISWTDVKRWSSGWMFISETNILIKTPNEKVHITPAVAISRVFSFFFFVHRRHAEETCLLHEANTKCLLALICLAC